MNVLHVLEILCSIINSLWPSLCSNFQLVQLLSCVYLRSHGLQHTRLPCTSPSPQPYSNSCPLSRWCHPAISSSIIPLSSHLKSFPAPGSSLMSQFFTSGGQSVGVSALTSLLPVNIQDWFPLGWTGCTSLQSKRLSRVSPTPQFKSINSLAFRLLYGPTLTSIHDYWENHRFD